MDFRFGKRYKLCSQKLIDDVYSSGIHVKQYPFVVKYKLVEFQEKTPFQLVISAPKRSFRLAVQRNRIKRLAKEAVRFNKHVLEDYLNEHNQQIALFLIFTSREEIDLKTLNRKTEKLFQTIVHQLKTL